MQIMSKLHDELGLCNADDTAGEKRLRSCLTMETASKRDEFIIILALRAGFRTKSLSLIRRDLPICLAFGIELNSFQTIDEEDVVSYWFLVGDQDIADFSNYLADNYGRQVETFLPTSLEEARKIQVEFGRIGERFRFQIVSQRSGELISLASGVWHAVLNIKPIYKLTWDCLDKSDFADKVRLRPLYFQSGHKPQLDFSKIELHIRDLIQ